MPRIDPRWRRYFSSLPSLGAPKASITLNVYAHLCPGADDKAAQVVEAMFKRVALLEDEGARRG